MGCQACPRGYHATRPLPPQAWCEDREAPVWIGYDAGDLQTTIRDLGIATRTAGYFLGDDLIASFLSRIACYCLYNLFPVTGSL